MVRSVNRFFVRQGKKKSDKPPGCVHCLYAARLNDTSLKLRIMPYRLLEHIADLCFEVTAASFSAVVGGGGRATPTGTVTCCALAFGRVLK